MNPAALAALLAAASAGAGVTIVQSTTVIRVPAHFARRPAPPPVALREKHGPRCIAAGDIAAAAVTGPDSVDFELRGGVRVRARLEDACPALDFYRGFYVTPQPDGRVCADRDAIRTRSGGECQIDRFRALVPVAEPAAAARRGT